MSFVEIWIMGDSIPFWAGRRADQRGIPNLRLPGDLTVAWKCTRGLQWSEFHHNIQRELLFCSSQPQVILLHLGGNDLNKASLCKIRKMIRREVKFLYSVFPNTTIVWCDILQRRVWRGLGDNINVAMERKRRRVNGFGRSAVTSKPNGRYITIDIDYLTEGFFRSDGVHLSDVGLDMLLDGIRECLLTETK